MIGYSALYVAMSTALAYTFFKKVHFIFKNHLESHFPR